ncbi:MAG TPA: peptidase [bacterium]|nr:peptidase [bacterium]
MSHMLCVFSTLTAVLVVAGCGTAPLTSKAPVDYLSKELAKFAPVELKADLSHLSVNDKKCLEKLIKAAEVIDQMFLRQVDPQNPQLLKTLEKNQDQPYLDFFRIMYGPWNRLDHDKPFLNDRAKPAGAGFYPPDMTKEEFEAALAKNPDQRKRFESNFTVIRRVKGELRAVSYHLAYQPYTKQISELLEEAAALTDDATLKKYLQLRSHAFLTDNYYESDLAWMDLNGDLEVVIGPYEVYEDNLFNYKAAYEAFLCVVDKPASEKLSTAALYLKEMEAHLPIAEEYKSSRGLASPIKVVQEVLSAGDTRAGVQTTAFNLPNDERVREAKGSKKVMLKNVAQAKYDKCWIPIAHKLLAERPLQQVSFDMYFNHVLMHEMSHGLGPGMITQPNGERVDVAKLLKEHYSIIEECKADVLGVYNLLFLMDRGVFPKDEYGLFATYLGGMFRSIRFGINEAHGGGVAIQFNYLMEKGAFFSDSQGRLDFDEQKMAPALAELAHHVLMLQATGDYAGTKEFVNKYRLMSPVMQNCIDKLQDAPVDIRPTFIY